MARLTIRDNDHGYRLVLDRVRNFGQQTTAAGIYDGKPHPTAKGLTTAALGAIHELGLGHVPQRSFLRAWVDTQQKTWLRTLHDAVKAYLFGGAHWSTAFGTSVVEGVTTRIRRGIFPRLAPETIRRAGGRVIPLIDTEEMINDIRWKYEGQR